MLTSHRLAAVTLATLTLSAVQWAEAAAPLPLALTATVASATRVASVSNYPRLEWHGYFRFRPDWISNGHLGQAAVSELNGVPVLTTSALMPPLSQWPQNNGQTNVFSSRVGRSLDEDSQVSATARLRLRPTLHLHRNVRMTVTADLLDNYVFGSRPSFGAERADVPLSAFNKTQKPLPVAFKEAFVELGGARWRLRIGRQAVHWGLGIFQHAGMGTAWDDSRPIALYGQPLSPGAGSGYDLDFGDFVDRAQLDLNLKGLHVRLFGDYMTHGLTRLGADRVDSLQWDMGGGSAVIQAGVALGQWVDPSGRVDRLAALAKPGAWVVDWGLLGLYRSQAENSFGEATSAFVVDGWTRLEHRPAASKRLVLEGEALYIGGEIGSKATVAMWGGALKGAFQFENMGVSFDLGAASGDDTRCFATYGPGGCGLRNVDGELNSTVSALQFHRNFRVDGLLFRDVIGAVTNAWYLRPGFSFNAHPFYAPGDVLGAELSVLVAGAMQEAGTPGNGSTLGTEFTLRAYVGMLNSFITSVQFSYLLAGDALDLVGPTDEVRGKWRGATESIEADNAWRLMIRSGVSF